MQIIEVVWLVLGVAFLTIPLGRWDFTIAIVAAGVVLYAMLKAIVFELKREAKDAEAPKTRQ